MLNKTILIIYYKNTIYYQKLKLCIFSREMLRLEAFFSLYFLRTYSGRPCTLTMKRKILRSQLHL